MRALLDTHVLLWWSATSSRLPPAVHSFLQDSGNELFWSVASTWEVVIKERLGKLRLPSSPEAFFSQVLPAQSLTLLPIRHEHALEVHQLPSPHRDPFDRMLVAQARVEGLLLLSGDPVLAQYPVRLLW